MKRKLIAVLLFVLSALFITAAPAEMTHVNSPLNYLDIPAEVDGFMP